MFNTRLHKLQVDRVAFDLSRDGPTILRPATLAEKKYPEFHRNRRSNSNFHDEDKFKFNQQFNPLMICAIYYSNFVFDLVWTNNMICIDDIYVFCV